MTADQSTLESLLSSLLRCLQLGPRAAALQRGSPLLGGLPEFESMAVVHMLGALDRH